MSKYLQHPNALNSSSKRVRIRARVSHHPVSDLTIDTAADVPCISASFIKSHPILQHLPLKPVPAGAIQLNSADGSALEILGYIRFNLTLGDITLPVEALVLPNLGPDKMLLDNSIMNAFGAVLDWCGEQLSFKNSTRKIPAKHKRTNSQVDTDGSAPAQISIVALDPSVGAVPVYLRRKCCIPPEHEMTVDVVTENAPSETTPALIEPRIVIAHDFESSDNVPQAFRRVVVARTVCNWSAVDKSAAVQIGNPSKRHVHLERDTILGYISPVKSVAEKTVSAVNSDQTTFRHKRDELKGAMKKAFTNTTFTPQQCSQVLDLCAKYRNVFSLSPKELGECTIAEADFPLEPGTKPVDRAPYRANPRAQEVIDKCVDQMEKDGIIEQRPSSWGSAVTIVAKADGTPRFCVDYRSTINKSLIRKSWPMPDIESHIDTVGGAKFITVCDIQSAYHQIGVKADEQDKTAFVTHKGKWIFKRLPFGIANAPF